MRVTRSRSGGAAGERVGGGPVSTAELLFPDAESLTDLRTFVRRAKAADEDGAVRLRAHGTTLAVTVGVLAGTGVMAEGTVLGLRAVALAEPADVDATVPLAAVADRLARDDSRALPVPPTLVHPAWAAVTAPRAGWERVGSIPADLLNDVAREGIAQIATGAPEGSGAKAVAGLRRAVWARPTTTVPPVTAGGAFVAYALGFSRPGTAVTVWAHGRWTRLSTPAGHVLMR
jgi:hypothetical protein